MNIAYDIDFEQDEVAALAGAMGCTEQEVAAQLPSFAKAAMREYADMMIGDPPMGTAADLRERRLVGIITIALGGTMPDANRVARLFNIAQSSSRALLRSVMAKHRRRLDAALRAETAAFLVACAQDAAGEWKVVWLNPVLIETLNDRLENAKQSKERIRRDPEVLGGYILPNGSYDWVLANP